ncbi:hypothetical protein B0H14DRAFT_2722014 [Mycena olivaceomarginata]|nr:hypothetical protein B0H14DRAFT_2722014 [Mycena olivaceomarginata]
MLQFFNGIAQNIGNLWELPTYHGIHAVDPKLVDVLLKGFINAASGDNQDIYNAAAAYLGPQNVFLNSAILDVDRSFGVQETAAGGVCILSTSASLSSSANVTTLIKARKLLIAIPPSLRTLTAAHLDLDAHERFLFAKLHGLTYGVTVFSYPGLNSSNTYNNIGTHTPYNLLTLPGAFSYSPPWAASFRDHAMVVHGTAAGNPNDVMFEFLKIHAPFRLTRLTPSAHDVANGAYKDLYALEGRRNTFWTDTAWSEQDSSQIWWWSELSLLPKMEAALRAR